MNIQPTYFQENHFQLIMILIFPKCKPLQITLTHATLQSLTRLKSVFVTFDGEGTGADLENP